MSDVANVAANVATAIGLPVGLAGVVLALRTYRSQVLSAAEAHMHSLFREYLAGGARIAAQDLQTFRLYVLEEMVDWLVEQDHFNTSGWRIAPSQRRSDELDRWDATIASHMEDDCEILLKRVREYPDCYGDDFQRYLAAVCKRPVSERRPGSKLPRGVRRAMRKGQTISPADQQRR